MKKLVLSFFVLCLSTTTTFAQSDPNFASDGFSPFWNNPAATGSANSFSTNLIYQNLWPSIPSNFQNFAFNIEADTKFGLKNSMEKLNLPIGLNVVHQQMGLLDMQTINIPISYPIKLKNSTLAIGVSAGIKRITYKLEGTSYFGEQFNYVDGSRFDLNAGLFWTGKNHYLGLSSTNLTQPTFDGYQASRHYNLQAGYRFKVGKHHIYPMLNSVTDLVIINTRIMTYFQFKEDIFSIGAGISSHKNYYLGATIKIMKFKLAYLYYENHSTLSNYSAGSHEVRLSFAIAK
ncbi:hypothetical protein DNU06_12955 [Putridiphycobacter roseus]|uniref:Type IX secretion system membrane protein PorP/SprF n=1 Tax=Putridiphycobacter roseus TaxID=2219161 RepID=A0A2W1N0J3_9FLAO|nr:PorP/SprF family type IX secretion system membrane protein [Putridiphycobacter roseus]PZE16451.1 hypothetical protein DNU06_12955 [Putridiphycobacter roseus]